MVKMSYCKCGYNVLLFSGLSVNLIELNVFSFFIFHFYSFVVSDFTRLASVLLGCVSVPVHGDSSPFILPSFTEVVVTPLQEGVLQALVVVEKEVSKFP